MIKPNAKTKLTGKKLDDNIKKALKALAGASVTVGVHEDAGKYPDGTSVVDVAIWNEYGTSKIPERSFMRSAIHANTDLLNQWRQDLLGKALDGRLRPQQALAALGLRIQELIRTQIERGTYEPNAPSTVRRKLAHGVAPRPLIDTGLLLRSIGFKVSMGKGGGHGGGEDGHGGGHGE